MRIRVIRPSSREQDDLLPPRLEEMRAMGHDVIYTDLAPDPAWAYTAASAKARSAALCQALADPDIDVVWSARGGYGASELLPFMTWDALKALRPKPLVGFSDISALHAALYTKIQWPGFHAPMPATSLWGKNNQRTDLDATFSLLEAFVAKKQIKNNLHVKPLSLKTPPQISGPLFGGCFSVLTSLIGTPFFPDLAGHILFIEDIDEHPARLMRAWQQWVLAGIAPSLKALVIGNLHKLGTKIPDNADFVMQRFVESCPVPVFHSSDFGHISPNYPLIVGAQATIDADQLTYTYNTLHA